MKKLQKLFKSCFETDYATAEANYFFSFSCDKEYKDESLNYVFTVDVESLQDSTTTRFICYVERCEDNSGIGLAIYYKQDKTFFDFKKIEL